MTIMLIAVLQPISIVVRLLMAAFQVQLIVMEERYTIAREALGYALTKLLLAHVLEAQFIVALLTTLITGPAMEDAIPHRKNK